MDSESPPVGPGAVSQQAVGPVTEELLLTSRDRGGMPNASGARRRTTRWVIALVVVVIGAGIALATTDPFGAARASRAGVADHSDPTGTYSVVRQDLSSQTEVPATLGYAGSFTIAIPSGASAQDVTQAQQTVTADQQSLSADQQIASAKASADAQTVAAAQTDIATAQATVAADQASEAQACAGSGASSGACSQAEEKVNGDQVAVAQARQQLAADHASAIIDHDQDQAKVASDETKLANDQATLATLQDSAVNPGTTFTSLPTAGEVVKEGQPLYSLDDQPVPLLYGPIPAYRAFDLGMADGADVGELTQDLIALGYGAGLTQSDHYSTATATAVKRLQSAHGLPTTGEILLGQVVFEPGPIRATSVSASVGQSAGGGGGSGGAGGAGGGEVLSATSTTRQISIALDASQQSEVAVGDKVTITLPDNETTPGVVSSVGTVTTVPTSTQGGGSSDGAPTITVLVSPTDPAATGAWDEAPVNVTITTGTVAHALVVPVDALLAQAGGGYAVEVVGAQGIHHLVPVTLGLFDDAEGLVQVTGTALAAGQRVVVPKL